ncbi:hypothetical protein AAHH79_37835, partial [Burkholderia pseudomallei]
RDEQREPPLLRIALPDIGYRHFLTYLMHPSRLQYNHHNARFDLRRQIKKRYDPQPPAMKDSGRSRLRPTVGGDA